MKTKSTSRRECIEGSKVVASLKKLVLILAVLAVVVVGVVFVLENQAAASIVFFGLATPQLPIAVWMIVALLIGAIVGPLCMAPVLMVRRRRRRMMTP